MSGTVNTGLLGCPGLPAAREAAGRPPALRRGSFRPEMPGADVSGREEPFRPPHAHEHEVDCEHAEVSTTDASRELKEQPAPRASPQSRPLSSRNRRGGVGRRRRNGLPAAARARVSCRRSQIICPHSLTTAPAIAAATATKTASRVVLVILLPPGQETAAGLGGTAARAKLRK